MIKFIKFLISVLNDLEPLKVVCHQDSRSWIATSAGDFLSYAKISFAINLVSRDENI